MKPYTGIFQLAVIALAATLLLACGGPAAAQTYFVNISGSTPNLGTVVSSAASPDTTWRISPIDQSVTKLSGSAVRLSTNLTRATVTVSCTGSGCDKGTVNVNVGTVGTPTNRARKLTNLSVAMGSAVLKTAATGTDPIAFSINAIGSSPKTFYVGADFAIAPDSSGLGTGVSTAGFYVSVAKAPATNAASGTGAATATVYRPISISSSQALDFGVIVKPASGSGSISVSKTDGSATVTGGVLLKSSSTKQALFTVSGEGGRQISLTLPTSFNLTGASTIPVTLTTDAISPNNLDATLGSAGVYNFSYGGSFNFDSTTPTGAYTGSYSVTASYN